MPAGRPNTRSSMREASWSTMERPITTTSMVGTIQSSAGVHSASYIESGGVQFVLGDGAAFYDAIERSRRPVRRDRRPRLREHRLRDPVQLWRGRLHFCGKRRRRDRRERRTRLRNRCLPRRGPVRLVRAGPTARRTSRGRSGSARAASRATTPSRRAAPSMTTVSPLTRRSPRAESKASSPAATTTTA